MEEKIVRLDELTQDKVSVVKQKYIAVNGVEYFIEGEYRKAYINSERGREELNAEIKEPHLNVILAMWGDNATIIEPSAI